MNRQQKRMMQRQGQLGEDGEPVAVAAGSGGSGGRRTPASRRQTPNRPGLGARIAQFMRDVRSELGKVLWPGRAEVVNYSIVVFSALILLALLIFGLNYVFAKGVLFLFKS